MFWPMKKRLGALTLLVMTLMIYLNQLAFTYFARSGCGCTSERENAVCILNDVHMRERWETGSFNSTDQANLAAVAKSCDLMILNGDLIDLDNVTDCDERAGDVGSSTQCGRYLNHLEQTLNIMNRQFMATLGNHDIGLPDYIRPGRKAALKKKLISSVLMKHPNHVGTCNTAELDACILVKPCMIIATLWSGSYGCNATNGYYGCQRDEDVEWLNEQVSRISRAHHTPARIDVLATHIPQPGAEDVGSYRTGISGELTSDWTKTKDWGG